MICLLISFILDILFGYFTSDGYFHLNLFFPLIFISSIPVSYILEKNKKLFLIFLIFLAVLYDLLFSSIFFINTFFVILYYLIIRFIYNEIKVSVFNLLIISTLGFVSYDIYIFLFVNLLDYATFSNYDLYYKLYNSFLINFLYIVLVIILNRSRIFGFKNKKLF